MHPVGATFKCRNRIDYTQAPVLMAVPVDPNLSALLIDYLPDETGERARAVWSRVPYRIGNYHGVRTGLNRSREQSANRLRARTCRIFSSKHDGHSLFHREADSLLS